MSHSAVQSIEEQWTKEAMPAPSAHDPATALAPAFLWARGWMRVHQSQKALADEGLRDLESALRSDGLTEARFAHVELANLLFSLPGNERDERAHRHLQQVSPADPFYLERVSYVIDENGRCPSYETAEADATCVLNSANGTPLQMAHALLGRAAVRHTCHQYKAAIADCLQAAWIAPGFIEPYRYLVGIYLELKDYDKAIEHLQRTVKARPNQKTWAYFLNLGAIYRLQARESPARRTKILEEATCALQLAIQSYEVSNDGNRAAWTDLRQIVSEQPVPRRFTGAHMLPQARRPRANLPGPTHLPGGRSLRERGMARLQRHWSGVGGGKGPNATAERSSDAQHQLMELHIDLAQVLTDLRRFPEARAEWERALVIGRSLPATKEYSPALGTIHTNLGYVNYELKRFPEAIGAYNDAISHYENRRDEPTADADKAWAVYALACTRNDLAYLLHAERNTDIETGLALVESALTGLDYLDSELNLKMATPDSLTNPDRKTDRNWNDEVRGMFLDTRGWLFYQQGRTCEAEGDITEAIRLTGGTASEHEHLMHIYQQHADTCMLPRQRQHCLKQAMTQWEKMMALDTNGGRKDIAKPSI
jgi:tetratricopeptide (TPR) repeat protein